MDFREKHIVVTGAASGMGKLFVLRFLELGAVVAAWDIDEDGLRRLTRDAQGLEITPRQKRLFVYTCDLMSPEAIEESATKTLEDLDQVDVLVNNAGVVSGNWISDLSDQELVRTFSINTFALFRVTRAFLPAMIRRGEGHVVTMASAGGLIGTPRLSDYSASKSAAVAFDESLRLEMKSQGHAIKTTLICPFFVDTGMFSGVHTRFSWLLPILRPEIVVEKAIRTIHRQQARLIMPWFVYTVFLLRLFPVSWFDRLASFFGISRSMDHFEGRKTSE